MNGLGGQLKSVAMTIFNFARRRHQGLAAIRGDARGCSIRPIAAGRRRESSSDD